MAERQQFVEDLAPDPELLALLTKARSHVLTDDELREQRVSFAFGNAMNLESVTKESVRHSLEHLRLRA